jgi:hypothetical protein
MVDLSDRVARTRLLLETLNDPYPTPRGALRSDSGPAASRYVPCDTCRRQGRVRTRKGYVLCLVCDGVGWKRREAGEEEWDAYLELPVERAVELPTMGVVQVRQEPDVLEESYSWERARQTHDRHGSYKEIRIRLDDLGLVQPVRYRLVRAVLVDKEPVNLSPFDDVEMTLGVVWIALRMRSIRVPPWIMERSRSAERRETIQALHADGYSASEIARRTGLSRMVVRRRIRALGAVNSGQAGTAAARV